MTPRRAGIVGCGIGLVVLLLWLLATESPWRPGQIRPDSEGRVNLSKAEDSLSANDLVNAGADQRTTIRAHRMVEVVDAGGRGIENARIFLVKEIDTVVRKSDRREIGVTDSLGQLQIPEDLLSADLGSHLAARATGWLPNSKPVALGGDAPLRLVLEPEHRQRFRCVDLNGVPVAGIVVMLSRKVVPRTFCAEGLDPDLEPGFDPVDASLAVMTDEAGIADFRELRRGAYKFQIHSEYYEQVFDNNSKIRVEVPTDEHVIRLAPLLCAVVQVVGDELYSWSVTTSSSLWMNQNALTRSLFGLRRRLEARYPGALCYVTGHGSSDATVFSVTAELWLAHAGKRMVEIPLVPAYTDPEPIVITAEAGEQPNNIAEVVFTIRDSVGRSVACPHMSVFRTKSVLPLYKDVTPGQPMRLPFGDWNVATRYGPLERHFQPQTIHVSKPEESFEISLDIELVPVLVEPVGYRGRIEQAGRLEFTQFGRRGGAGGRALDQTLLWLRPGETQWYFGTDSFYETFERMIPVESTPEGTVQTIRFDLVLKDGR